MSIYYEVEKDSEAHKILYDFAQKRSNKIQEMQDAVKSFGSDEEVYLRWPDGSLAGVNFSTQPIGWKKVNGKRNYYMPYAKNKDVWNKIPKMEGLGASDIAVLIFNKCPTLFKEMRFSSGIAYQQVGDTFYIEHCDCEVLPIVKGITKIKESKYIACTKEMEAGE